MLNFSVFKNYKAKVSSSEYHISNFIPYKEHLDFSTVLLKDNSMLRVIKLIGYPFETADDEDVDINKSIRNQLFKSVSSGHFSLDFHLIRRRESSHAHSFFAKKMPNYFGDYVRRRWRQKHRNRSSFVNELYVSVVRKSNKKVEFLTECYRKLTRQDTREGRIADLKIAYEEIEEMTNRLLISLRNYSPVLLGVKKVAGVPRSEVMTFLSRIINCGISQAEMFLYNHLDRSLAANRMYFGRKSLEIVTPSGSEYAAIVSLKEYGQSTIAGMLDSFLQVPYEMVITQSFQFVNRQVAINKMQVQQSRMLQTQDKALSQIAEITRALDDAMSGRIAFGLHHLTILCREKTEKALENAISLVESELTNAGVYPVREKVNLEPAFWAQLPGNFDYLVRKATISTLNLAGFASQHNYPFGKQKGNHWGDAVTVFDTTSGTPFYFNFHCKDVGHTLIIGPTGAGKTVLLNFLCAQSMKFQPKMFFFDKDRGAEIFIRALGGVYTVIEPRTKSGLNPLQIDDTPENRTFLVEWFKALTSCQGEDKFTASEIALLNDAVSGNFKLDKEDRVLTNLAPFFGLETGNSIATRFLMWYGSGSHAALFDNAEDNIDFTKASVFGFEMGNLLKDPYALAPVLLYLFHRISVSLDGSPCMIILDEAWALIDNPVFGPTIKDWLKVLRKLNTFVVFATQSVEDASKSAISDTLVQQTATQIFLPNLKATDVYRSVFMLSEREYSLIKNTDPATRFFLIKQAMSAVIARINLAGMEDIISVLSGRAETVILLHTILEEYGEDPKVWLPVFYKKVAEME